MPLDGFPFLKGIIPPVSPGFEGLSLPPQWMIVF